MRENESRNENGGLSSAVAPGGKSGLSPNGPWGDAA